MSDNGKEAEAEMAKAIFISADCWLGVFDLLPASQIGLGIAMISHRFDFYVDEHFKTRKWKLKPIAIQSKNGENGIIEMEIVKSYHGKPYAGKVMPIPQKPLPKKVVGIQCIIISYIDQNVIDFLHRFHQLFATCPINLFINATKSDHYYLESILRNIWPMLKKNICAIKLSRGIFHRLRQFAPSILNDCPSLRFVSLIFDDLFTEFPANDSATASDGQAVANWLFTPLQNDVPKVLKCSLNTDYKNLASKIEAFKTAFANASSPANFIVVFWFPSSFATSVMPFEQTNELTREQLELKRTDYIDWFYSCFLLIRRPIARDANKWTKWEEEAIRSRDQWNRIDIRIDDDEIGDGLLDTTPDSSDYSSSSE